MIPIAAEAIKIKNLFTGKSQNMILGTKHAIIDASVILMIVKMSSLFSKHTYFPTAFILIKNVMIADKEVAKARPLAPQKCINNKFRPTLIPRFAMLIYIGVFVFP